MKARNLFLHIKVSTVLCILLLLKHMVDVLLINIPFLLELFGIGKNASAIGVIGGAVGTTTVFLSSPFWHQLIMPVLEFFGLLYIFFVLLQCYKKHQTSN